MSKTTKIIAALGVVAGLGVAALPAFTYAVGTDGAVELEVNVEPAIAMTIVSNGDTTTGDNPETTTYYSTSNAAYANGVNIDSNTLFTKSGGLFTNHSSAKTSLLPGAISEEMTSTITVYTNNANGYTLVVKDEDPSNALSTSGSSPATIAAFENPTTLTAGSTVGWGINGGDAQADDAQPSDPKTYYAIPASTAQNPLTIKGNGATGSEATTVTYGVGTAKNQAQGVYSDVIVYTATTK